MFENIDLDLQKYIDFMIKIFYLMFKIPIEFWGKMPWFVRWSFYLMIFAFAVFMAWLTIKYKDEWRYRA